MAEIKYGHREGPGHGKEYPVAANQYFHNRGGHFVYLVNGNVTLVGSSNKKIAGWAEIPKQAAGYESWKSSSTAEADSVFVITGVDDVFEVPCLQSQASLNASWIGAGVGIVNATMPGESTMYEKRQQVVPQQGNTPAATPLTIVAIDKDNSTVLVKISPDHKQAI